MENFSNNQKALSFILLYFIIFNAGILPAEAQQQVENKMKDNKIDAQKLSQVELPETVIEMMTQMGGNCKKVAEKKVLTKEDIAKIKEKGQFYSFAKNLISLYARNAQKEDAKSIKEFAKWLDNNQSTYNFGFSLSLGHEPYLKNTRYAVTCLEDALASYDNV